MTEENKDQQIRAVSRAIHVLQAINRHGSLTMTQISRAVDLPYPTTGRVVQTLVSEGIIEREKSRKHYRPTALSQSLSCGYQPRVRLVAIARPHIEKITKETGWPVSLASRVGSVMVIQDSTHSLTTMTFSDYHPGYSFPILASASGMAYLTFTDEEDRQNIIEQIKRSSLDEEDMSLISRTQDNQFEMIREDGYASFIRNLHTKDPGKTSSISVPLYYDEKVVGTMTLSFFSTSMRVVEAFDKYRDLIFEAQANINHDLAAMKLFKPEELKLG